MDASKVTTPRPFCFVLMPFSSQFDDIYKIGIKEACEKAGAYCERVDEQIYGEKILDRVYNQISKADIVIADMTGRNPNVFYEVGYAHALGKLTILLTQNSDDIPFDLRPFPHIVYEKGVGFLRDELERRVKYFVDNPPDKISDTKIGLDLYLEKKNLASERVTVKYSPYSNNDLRLTVYNSSTVTWKSGSFKVGLIGEFEDYTGLVASAIELPNGKILIMLNNFSDLFPNGYVWKKFGITFGGSETNFLLRLFTPQGSTDFSIALEVKKHKN